MLEQTHQPQGQCRWPAQERGSSCTQIVSRARSEHCFSLMIAKDMFVLWTFMTSSHMRRLLRLHYDAEGNDFAVEDRAAPTTIRRAISDFFSGDLCAVNSIPVTTGGTSFQREVWAALRTIEAGTT